MPIRSPGYNIPAFQATGNAEVDAALSQWHTQFGQQYTETQQAIERIPAIFSTNTVESTNNPKSNYLVIRVPLQGGEQVTVTGYFDFTVTAGGVLTTDGANFNELAEGKLKVIYPSGSTHVFGSNQTATLRVGVAGQGTSEGVVARTSVTNRANVSFVWPIETRIQNGGEHTFVLRTTGSGNVNSGSIQVMAL